MVPVKPIGSQILGAVFLINTGIVDKACNRPQRRAAVDQPCSLWAFFQISTDGNGPAPQYRYLARKQLGLSPRLVIMQVNIMPGLRCGDGKRAPDTFTCPGHKSDTARFQNRRLSSHSHAGN